MARIEITPHAKERTLQRIGQLSVNEFLEGVRRGVERLPGGKNRWAIKVVKTGVVLGYAVGKGTIWTTTISGGQVVDHDQEVVVVVL